MQNRKRIPIYTIRDGKEQKHSPFYMLRCLTPSLRLYPILLDSLMVKLQTVNLSDTGSSPVLAANLSGYSLNSKVPLLESGEIGAVPVTLTSKAKLYEQFNFVKQP